MLGAGFEAGVGTESEQARGLIPRVFDDVFARLQAMKDQAEVGPGPNRSCIAAASQLHFENGRSLCRPSCGEVFSRTERPPSGSSWASAALQPPHEVAAAAWRVGDTTSVPQRLTWEQFLLV